jgi:hypothetical protein
MHWIDERIRESQEHADREMQIANEQARIYEDLSRQIKQDTDRANKAGGFSVKITGNAALHDRTIECDGRKFNLKLDSDTHAISAFGDNIEFIVVLGICGNGGVCLKDASGNEVLIPDAARMILDPFLFPHLTPESKAAIQQKIWAKLAQ